ncbi:diguanylate cyclase [uncultured Psychrosphaera sp.]|uniref:sensor domain-containing diguanylate cyclase n=1 Tax=uncultured Psychrosphaera sp. TaxID=1403522 RepID=UPI0026231E44|nr:diguanylate cyclase [uncultured Psychrosphaera sp.]
MHRFIFTLITILYLSVQTVSAKEIELSTFETSPIGSYLTYFLEKSDQRLSLKDAQLEFDLGSTLTQSGQTISKGFNVETTWFKTSINNSNALSSHYRLSIESPWLDYIDVYFVNPNGEVEHIIGGDHLPISEQPIFSRFFATDMQFEQGVTDLYIRIQTEAIMPVPIKLSTLADAITNDGNDKFEYGFLYGILVALALYNLVLFFSIRKKIFGLYVLYISGFVLNSMSYTGWLFTFYTPHHGVHFQDYVDVSLMITYSIIGLHFGRRLLDTHLYAPNLNKAIANISNAIPFIILGLFVMDQLHLATIVAFLFNTSFAILTITLGILAVRAKASAANLYLISSVTAAICVSVSTAAVAGLLPYNSFTFKAIEVGMAFEGIILAVALATRFRDAQRDKERAEEHARKDELTDIFNRRGFKYATAQLFPRFRQTNENFALFLLDIDKFKLVNDKFGHATGDLVIIQVTRLIDKTIRTEDIVARWGGEEFIVLLAIKDETEALLLAENLRCEIENLETQYFDENVKVTASIGVSITNFTGNNQLRSDTEIFEKAISNADNALYQAKSNGRNTVCFFNAQNIEGITVADKKKKHTTSHSQVLT